MIIHQPEVRIEGNEVIVSSRIETSTDTPLPKYLWYKFPVEYQDAVTDRAEGFLSNLFLLSMHLNEDIEIRGDVSPRMAQNISQYHQHFYQASPKNLNLIDFNFQSLKKAEENPKRNVHLSAFSAGSDSFYTFWSHFYPEKSQHPTHITHGIFIEGFDIFLKKNAVYKYYLSNYQKLFKQWGLTLIPSSTNMYHFIQFKIPWTLSLVPSLIGSSMILGNLVSNFNIPGSFEDASFRPRKPAFYSSMISTETLDISLHAGDLSRGKKIVKMMDWSPVQKQLRTCINMNQSAEKIACLRCEKCLNTALLISLQNRQEQFPAYGRYPSLYYLVYMGLISVNLKSYYPLGYLDIMKQNKRYDLIFVFWLLVPINKIKVFFKNTLIHLIPKSLIYPIKKIVFKSHINPQEN